MKPHVRGTELKVGTTRSFTQPNPEVESDAELDKANEDGAPATDAPSQAMPNKADPGDI